MDAKRDANRVPTLIGISTADGATPILAEIDPDTGELLVKPSLSTGASTSAKQDDIITELQKKPDEATTPTVFNVTLTNANTEYSQALPTNTKELRFRCRTLYDIRYAWVTGKVATPTEPYLTLPAGSDYWSDRNDLNNQTLFFASSTAGVSVEIECWT